MRQFEQDKPQRLFANEIGPVLCYVKEDNLSDAFMVAFEYANEVGLRTRPSSLLKSWLRKWPTKAH